MGFLNDDKKDKLNSFVKFVKKELEIEIQKQLKGLKYE